MKRLFWDLEVSPNVIFSWRVGRQMSVDYNNIIKERAIICVAWKWEKDKAVNHLTWKKGDDRELLRKFGEVACSADELIAHNGDRFDVRWINTRNLFHRLPPLPHFKTVDTLKFARENFYFNSNRLDYIGKFLGIGGKERSDWSLWWDICTKGCPRAMAKMVKYCKRDTTMLQQVWEQLSAYAPAASHAGVVAGRDKWSCPHCASESVIIDRHKVTARGTKQHQMQCKKCGRYYTINDKSFRDYRETRD